MEITYIENETLTDLDFNLLKNKTIYLCAYTYNTECLSLSSKTYLPFVLLYSTNNSFPSIQYATSSSYNDDEQNTSLQNQCILELSQFIKTDEVPTWKGYIEDFANSDNIYFFYLYKTLPTPTNNNWLLLDEIIYQTSTVFNKTIRDFFLSEKATQHIFINGNEVPNPYIMQLVSENDIPVIGKKYFMDFSYFTRNSILIKTNITNTSTNSLIDTTNTNTNNNTNNTTNPFINNTTNTNPNTNTTTNSLIDTTNTTTNSLIDNTTKTNTNTKETNTIANRYAVFLSQSKDSMYILSNELQNIPDTILEGYKDRFLNSSMIFFRENGKDYWCVKSTMQYFALL